MSTDAAEATALDCRHVPRSVEKLWEVCLVLYETNSKQGSLSGTESSSRALRWWEMGPCRAGCGGCAGEVCVALWLYTAVVWL